MSAPLKQQADAPVARSVLECLPVRRTQAGGSPLPLFGARSIVRRGKSASGLAQSKTLARLPRPSTGKGQE
jgi:hypothetical protein